MEDAKTRFKRAATRNFGDDEEKRYLAENVLDEHLLEYDEAELGNVVDTMESNQYLRPAVVSWICGVFLFVGLLIVSINLLKLYQKRSLIYFPGAMGLGAMGGDASLWGRTFDELNHEEKLILFGDKSQLGPARQMLGSVLAPVYLMISCLFAFGILYYHAQERRWVERDLLLTLSTDEPGLTTLEYRITQQLKKELRETMGWGTTKR